MRNLFGVGSLGEIVRKIQSTLTDAGFDTNKADGIYGNDTVRAVSAFQSANSLTETGTIDDGTWQILMKSPIPPAFDRCLELTASFENHGFGLAIGNFDGALLTWGIVGFTLASGEVQSIVLAVNESAPECVQQAFGTNAPQLLALMQASSDEQETWADSVTLPNGSLAEPWRSMFQAFGSLPEVQQEQIRHVQSDYMSPAATTAKNLGFTTELGLALCFDIHVQNGGIKPAAMNQIRAAQTPGMSELELRVVAANAVADFASPRWRDDVRKRKLTVATGQGVVHGHNYVLPNWGLAGDCNVPELTSTAVASP
ncbi:MAG TPA: peptidoglycan-binding protein [Candidatus Acidoferrum sp.]|nr:peptidoglycan-binding protein [Candidatus Acidoferrum sp.]